MTSTTVVVNGERVGFEREETLGTLLERLGVKREGTAVALNESVVPKGRIDEQRLQPGDRVEVIRAVAGG